MNKIWIVTAIDYGDSSDGKARVLAACKSEEEAKAYVHDNIKAWADERAGKGVEVDFNKMNAHYDINSDDYDYSCDDSCEWNIEEVEIPQ